MTRSALSTPSVRSALVAGGTALLVALPVLPAFADPSPSPSASASTAPTGVVQSSSVSLRTSAAQADYGTPVSVDGVLGRGAASPANQPITLRGQDGDSTRTVVLAHLTTDSSGKFHTTLTPERSVSLTAAYAGDAFSTAATSPAVALALKPKVSSAAHPASIVVGQSAVISGVVAPRYKSARVILQVFSNHAWRSMKETRTTTKATYSFTLTPRLGKLAYRAVLTPTDGHLVSASPNANIAVAAKDLVLGDEGSDVAALQRALAKLHYVPGKADGEFGQDLKHAVYAFEKVERLPRNGTWGKAERARLAHPRGIGLRFTASGASVDVDVTRQVLVYSEGGVIKMIMDVSTGGEYSYTDQGTSYRAHTPRGNYRIQRKIDGVRTSRLGYLYRPSYFFEGYAVHGEAYDVPPKPASHGCVRVTNRNADILFPLLKVGVPVHVFDE